MTKQDIERVKKAVIRKYPYFASIALLEVPIEEETSIPTAAVIAGKNEKDEIIIKKIIINPDFFDSLTFDEQIFVLAHETCHIAFKHFKRSMEKVKKDIEKRYEDYCKTETDKNLRNKKKKELERKHYQLWNIATDACINAFLQKDKLKIPKNVINKQTGEKMEFIDMADGLNRSAEVIYEKLVKKAEQEENKQEKNQNENTSQENSNDNQNEKNSQVEPNNSQNDNQDSQTKSDDLVGGGIDEILEKIGNLDDYQGIDSHDYWSVEEEKEESKEQERIDETQIFRKNNEERKKINQIAASKTISKITSEVKPKIQPKSIAQWKKILVPSIETPEEMYGYRRANKFNPNARLNERYIEQKSIIELVLDTSGSISDELLRGFLTQLLPLFQNSELYVGCFGGEFHGFKRINNIKEIENFRATRDSNGTNFEAAATAFSKNSANKKITKIVFTDGLLDINQSHIQRTKVNDIIWIVFGEYMDFKPLGGKIIKISNKELKEILNSNNKKR